MQAVEMVRLDLFGLGLPFWVPDERSTFAYRGRRCRPTCDSEPDVLSAAMLTGYSAVAVSELGDGVFAIFRQPV